MVFPNIGMQVSPVGFSTGLDEPLIYSGRSSNLTIMTSINYRCQNCEIPTVGYRLNIDEWDGENPLCKDCLVATLHYELGAERLARFVEAGV